MYFSLSAIIFFCSFIMFSFNSICCCMMRICRYCSCAFSDNMLPSGLISSPISTLTSFEEFMVSMIRISPSVAGMDSIFILQTILGKSSESLVPGEHTLALSVLSPSMTTEHTSAVKSISASFTFSPLIGTIDSSGTVISTVSFRNRLFSSRRNCLYATFRLSSRYTGCSSVPFSSLMDLISSMTCLRRFWFEMDNACRGAYNKSSIRINSAVM